MVVAVAVVALAPAALGVGALILAGVAAGAVFGFLNEGLNHGFGCASCLLKSTLKGAVVGGLAAAPFVFLPAAAGVAAFAAVGGGSGAIGYTADWALNGADPKQWSWKGFATSVGLGAVTAGAGRFLQIRVARAAQQNAIRQRVTANIVQSKAAREASNFGKAAPPPGPNVIRRIPLGSPRAPGPPGTAVFMKRGDQFASNAASRRDVNPNGQYDVTAHGNPSEIEVMRSNGHEVLVNHRVAARLIEQSPGYTPGQPVRMLSCSTGKGVGSFAQNLANKLGVPVSAPNDLLWAYGDGSTVVSEPTTWVSPLTGLPRDVPVQPSTGTFVDLTPGVH